MSNVIFGEIAALHSQLAAKYQSLAGSPGAGAGTETVKQPTETPPLETPGGNSTELPTGNNTGPAATETAAGPAGEPPRTIPQDPTSAHISDIYGYVLGLCSTEEEHSKIAGVIKRVCTHLECQRVSLLQKPEKKYTAVRYGLYMYDVLKSGGLQGLLDLKFDFEGGPQLNTELYPLQSAGSVENGGQNFTAANVV